MSRVLLAGSRAWTDTATTRDAVATVWGRGTAVLVSGAYPAVPTGSPRRSGPWHPTCTAGYVQVTHTQACGM